MGDAHRNDAAQMRDRAAAYWHQAVVSGRTIRAREAAARPPETRRPWTVENYQAVVTWGGIDAGLHRHLSGQSTAAWSYRVGRESVAGQFDLPIEHTIGQSVGQDVGADHGRQAATEPDQDSDVSV